MVSSPKSPVSQQVSSPPPTPPYSPHPKDIGYSVPLGVQDIAFTASFPLLTRDAVKLLRSELLHDAVRDLNGPFVQFVPGLSSCQVRGYGGLPDCGEFTKDLWTHPVMLKTLSQSKLPVVPLSNALETSYSQQNRARSCPWTMRLFSFPKRRGKSHLRRVL